jgi:hypothetical protein
VKYVTIIGSRAITSEGYNLIKAISSYVASRGYTVRHGNAIGSDQAARYGVEETLRGIQEIYLPWDGFPADRNPLWQNNSTDVKQIWNVSSFPKKIIEVYNNCATLVYPNFSNVTQSVQKLHSRGIPQVYGYTGNFSELVIYWSPHDLNNKPTGSTKTAVLYAQQMEISTINLYGKTLEHFNVILSEIRLHLSI